MKAKRVNKMPIALILGLCIAFLVIAIGYYTQAKFYESHYFPNTKINGMDYSNKTSDEAVDGFRSRINDYELTIKPREFEDDTIKASDIDLQFNNENAVIQILSGQDNMLWPFHFFEKHSYDIDETVIFNEEMLTKKVKNLSFRGNAERKPVDASIVYNENDKRYEIEKEDIGTTVVENELFDAVKQCISTGATSLDLTKDEKYYEAPKLTTESESVKKATEKANQYLKGTLTYALPTGVEKVDTEMIHSWLTVNARKGKVYLNKDAMKEFLVEMGQKYDTLSVPKKLHTQRGDTVTVNGFYGWQIDRDSELSKLIDNIKSGKPASREPIYSHRGEGSGDNQFGTTYAEVDLTNQKMYLVKNGKAVMSSDVVTGNTSLGRETPTGIYQLSYKDRNAVLRGQRRSDGTYAYESPVSYWMPFNKGIGFHDATWRSSFGGSIYKSNGSHGCVNMPYSKAKELYDYVYPGMVVIVYN